MSYLSYFLCFLPWLGHAGYVAIPCLFGGWSTLADNYTQSVDCWNPITRGWEVTPGYQLLDIFDRGATIDFGGLPCIVGGNNGYANPIHAQATFRCLNFTTSKWTVTALPRQISSAFTGPLVSSSPPTAPGRGGIPLMYQGYPMLAGGSLLTWNLNPSDLIYTGTINTSVYTGSAWVYGPKMNFPRSNAAGFTYNGDVCISGGTTSPNGVSQFFQSTTECLNTGGTWYLGPSMTITRNAHLTFMANGWWCAAGGSQFQEVAMNTIECLIPSTQTTLYPAAPVGGTLRWYNMSQNGWTTPANWFAGRTFHLDGLHCGTSRAQPSQVHCLNSSTLNSGVPQWIPYPSLTAERTMASVLYAPFWIPPTPAPTLSPTRAPTESPTLSPTRAPTASPTLSPTRAPTDSPTESPTLGPTSAPSKSPTFGPTAAPTTGAPSSSPTLAPTGQGWWSVDYPAVVVASEWTTFRIVPPANPPAPLYTLDPTWEFSSSTTTYHGAVLQFPPFTFTPGETLTFITRINDDISQPFHLSVLVSPLNLVVTGGDKEFPPNTWITLNASQTYDPDFPFPASKNLTFSWTLSNCPGFSVTSATTTGSTFSLHTGSGAAPLCTAAVNVSGVSTGKWRNFTTSLPVVVGQLSCNLTISGPHLIAISDTLRLLATVSISTGLSSLNHFLWTSSPSTRTAVPGCVLPDGASSDSRALSLGPGCLQEGSLYRFAFTVGNSLSNTTAWYNVQVAARPNGGNCTVSPRTGLATQTFEVTCWNWTQAIGTADEDNDVLPTSLSYALAVTEPSSGSGLLTITSFQSLPMLSTQLPASLPGSAGTMIVVLVEGFGGVITEFALPAVRVTAPTANCPLVTINQNSDLQTNTMAFLQLVESAGIGINCSAAMRSAAWDELWDSLQEAILDPTAPSNVDFLTTAFEVAVQTFPANASQIQQETLIDTLEFFAVNLNQPALAEGIIALSPNLLAAVQTNCTRVSMVATLLQQLVMSSISGHLPSDQPFTASSQGGLSVRAGFYFGDSSSSSLSSSSSSDVGVGSTTLKTTNPLLKQGVGSVSGLSITTYSGCRVSQQQQQQAQASSEIVDITLSDQNGMPLSVGHSGSGSGSGFSFSFIMPLSDMGSCGPVQCAWWNPSLNDWNNTGCSGQPIENDPSSYLCTCNHLTEFAVMLDPETCPSFRSAYLVLMVLYAILCVITAFKLLYRVLHRYEWFRPVVLQHVLILALSSARAVMCGVLASSVSDGWNLITRAIVFVFPYLLTFWIFTLMIFQWSALWHFGMKLKDRAFAHIQWLFLLCNFAVVAAVIACVAALSATKTTTRDAVGVGATITLAVVTFITAIAFLSYAYLLSRTMTKNSSNASSVRAANPCTWQIQHKILASGIAVSALMCVQAAMHLLSVATPRTGPIGNRNSAVSAHASEIILLLSDWLSLVVLLAMYHRAMTIDGAPKKATTMQLTAATGQQQLHNSSFISHTESTNTSAFNKLEINRNNNSPNNFTQE